MVPPPDMLAKGSVVVRVTGRYGIVEGTMDDFDVVFDALLQALLLDETIKDPDLILDLHEKILQVEFIVDTDDPFEAGGIAEEAMRQAFAVAKTDGPVATGLFVHEDLLKSAPSNVELWLVGV